MNSEDKRSAIDLRIHANQRICGAGERNSKEEGGSVKSFHSLRTLLRTKGVWAFPFITIIVTFKHMQYIFFLSGIPVQISTLLYVYQLITKILREKLYKSHLIWLKKSITPYIKLQYKIRTKKKCFKNVYKIRKCIEARSRNVFTYITMTSQNALSVNSSVVMISMLDTQHLGRKNYSVRFASWNFALIGFLKVKEWKHYHIW